MSQPVRSETPAEKLRLEEDARRERNWKRWGPYLSERQWATVREDYSPDGSVWDSFPHDQARSRAYRWGEDGLMGFCDREARLCFAVALWNGRDPILKERLFGLTGPEGNHGEDVKELYYYLDSTPTHSYAKALYKYPQAEFPYARLVEENRRRTMLEPEFELVDTGVFDQDRYFDVTTEYAKAGPDDLLVRITVANRGPEEAPIALLPTLWFRNNWAWGCTHEGCEIRPSIKAVAPGTARALHVTLGRYFLQAEPLAGEAAPELLFTENESNSDRLWGVPNATPHVKDAFHDHVVGGLTGAVNPSGAGTKCAPLYRLRVPPGGEVTVRLRLSAGQEPVADPFGPAFESVFADRIREAEEFYASISPAGTTAREALVTRQGYAGLLWSKQFYHYVVRNWLEGDPNGPAPPAERLSGRNAEWTHLFNRDVISMPDKWEYPWYAAWDLAFHMVPLARVDPQFAKEQLVLMLREWYMHPSGQIPAYEFAFGDVNPPVHAWACWRVYKITGARGQRDRLFLARVFQKLLINFTWWVNRKDVAGKNLFAGGFLGLDNIGVFDRSKPLPAGVQMAQADGTAWMAFYCATMLSMALELARHDAAYEDTASKFFEHFVAITDAMNHQGGTGLWDEEDGFYYDRLFRDGESRPMKIRSMVGLIPLFAVEILDQDTISKLPGFAKRMKWFLDNRADLARHISYMERADGDGHRLLAIPSRERLTRVLRYVLDENEFLSPHGIRALSRVHLGHPFETLAEGRTLRVDYSPGESTSGLFGGNSNWRGPIWMPVNFLLVEALERYHHFYGDSFRIECPTGSGNMVTLGGATREIARRLRGLFLPDATGARPVHGGEARYAQGAAWQDLVLFYEYFHGETGRGAGASHQTGWTSLVVKLIEALAQERGREAARRPA